MLEYKKTDSVRLSRELDRIEITDQTLLPERTEVLRIVSLEQMFEAIKSLRVRGAPAIGIFAAYCMYIVSLNAKNDEIISSLKAAAEYLASSRPTAVNLSYALNIQLKTAEAAAEEGRDIAAALLERAQKIHSDDIASCLAIAENALSLLHDGDGVLTHCNAGALACSRLGTGLGALLLSVERGKKLHAFVDETRPLLQGARLTAYELKTAGVPYELICDNMAAHFMQRGEINAVMVGCDRAAANGDIANKIGTLSAAVNAKFFNVPFYVCCPFSTIDRSCRSGREIPIEERAGEEITSLYYSRPVAPEGTACRNPAFDVTPSELITAIITERGIYRYPYDFSDN